MESTENAYVINEKKRACKTPPPLSFLAKLRAARKLAFLNCSFETPLSKLILAFRHPALVSWESIDSTPRYVKYVPKGEILDLWIKKDCPKRTVLRMDVMSTKEVLKQVVERKPISLQRCFH